MERNSSIDMSRAISMLYIVGFWHLFGYTEMINRIPFGDYMKNATLATFVLISGYILGKKYSIKSSGDLGDFLMKRIVRLIPLFAVALFSYYIVGFIELRTAILSLIGFSTILSPQPPTLWFVSMILTFYYLFPIISGRRTLIQIFIALSVFCIFYISDKYFTNIDRRFFYYWPCFAIGIIFSRIDLVKYLKSWKALLILLVFFVGISLIHFYNLVSLPQLLFRILISLVGAFSIVSIARFISNNNYLVKAGTIISYLSLSAYLFHRQIIDIIEKYIFWPEDGWFRVIYLIFFCLPVVLIIGYLVQTVYDFIIRKLLDNLKSAKN